MVFFVYRLAEYIGLLAHKDPGIDIFEVAAVTSSGTIIILEQFLTEERTQGNTSRYNGMSSSI